MIIIYFDMLVLTWFFEEDFTSGERWGISLYPTMDSPSLMGNQQIHISKNSSQVK